MLDADVVARIVDLIAAQTEPRQRALRESIRHETNDLARRGLLGSSAAVHRYSAVASDELRVRARVVWSAVRRSHASMVGRYSDDVLRDLGDQIAGHINAQAREIRELTLAAVKSHKIEIAQIHVHIEAVAQELIREALVEAQFYADDLRRPALRGEQGGPAITIHGNVGAVQTGSYAIANVQLAPADKDRLIAALDQLRQAIEGNGEVTHEQREQSIELVRDVAGAVSADKPNGPKIAGLLGALATTIQTVASLRGAWQIARDAAVAVGILEP